ncbi:MAG: GTP-binding protein [Candidatus Brocadiales bacterium]|nr:GTP-binding protein [Candidatus Bathyanammoxibius sp.]
MREKKKRLRKQRKGRRGKNDTIAAVTTPLGEGGIGVIQVSGPDALAIVDRIFRRKGGGRKVRGASSGELFYGTVVDAVTSAPVDEALVSIWRSEESPTGEDLVEINCHGGAGAVRGTLDTVVKAGARVGVWTEFLDRGRESARMDFLQMEALESLVNAKTRLEVRVLTAQYEKLLSQRVLDLETGIDVIAETINGGSTGRALQRNVSDKLAALLKGLDGLLDSAAFGLALSNPQKVSIAGLPNAGKSTLFNKILGQERAIVHHLPGTTRDYINEYFSIRGIPFELLDSAGLRETDEQVERKGVERARHLHKRADRIILVLDGSRDFHEQEWARIQELGFDRGVYKEKIITVVNKIDLGVMLDTERLAAMLDGPICHISALKGTGLDSLEKMIVGELFDEYIDCYETGKPKVPVVFTNRQRAILLEVRNIVRKLSGAFNDSGTVDGECPGVIREKLRELRCGDGYKGHQEIPDRVMPAMGVMD